MAVTSHILPPPLWKWLVTATTKPWTDWSGVLTQACNLTLGRRRYEGSGQPELHRETASLKNTEETSIGDWRVGSVGKVLWCEHEDLSSNPPHPSESQAYLCWDPRPQCWVVEAVTSPGGVLGGQSSQNRALYAQWEICLENQGGNGLWETANVIFSFYTCT